MIFLFMINVDDIVTAWFSTNVFAASFWIGDAFAAFGNADAVDAKNSALFVCCNVQYLSI
jgi:hypothetical protein